MEKDLQLIKEEVLEFLCNIHELSEGCLNHLRDVIKAQEAEAGDVLLKIGDVNERLYFIVSGAIHCFYYVDEKPVSGWFFFERETVVSIGSYYDQVPGDECLIAMERSFLLYIAKADYDYLNDTFPEFNYLVRVLLEKYLKIFGEHPKLIRKLSAKDRYKLVLERNPELVNRVPLNSLASWLGMEPETLYRIRAELKQESQNHQKGQNRA